MELNRSTILSTVEFKHLHSYNTRLRGEAYRGEINGSCNVPWNSILIHYDHSVFICLCDAWLPIPVGSVLDFNSIEEIFNSPKAKILQQDIADKKFTWCAVTHCGVIDQNIKMARRHLTINIDQSCNLACPSCRRAPIMIEEGPEMDEKLKCMDRIFSWLEKYNDPIDITMSGSSDCLASPIFRPVIRTYKPKENQRFEMFTNGLLMKKILPDAPILPNITDFKLSIDAGSADVYEVVRQPGKWSVLLENLNWLDQHRKSNPVNVKLAFTVQKSNYRDLLNFINLCNERNYKPEITQLDDWATWNSETINYGASDPFTLKYGTFKDNDVLNPKHPEHSECLEVLKEATKLTDESSFMKSIKLLLNKN